MSSGQSLCQEHNYSVSPTTRPHNNPSRSRAVHPEHRHTMITIPTSHYLTHTTHPISILSPPPSPHSSAQEHGGAHISSSRSSSSTHIRAPVYISIRPARTALVAANSLYFTHDTSSRVTLLYLSIWIPLSHHHITADRTLRGRTFGFSRRFGRELALKRNQLLLWGLGFARFGARYAFLSFYLSFGLARFDLVYVAWIAWACDATCARDCGSSL